METYIPIQYFRANVQQVPDRIAVRSDGITYTYRELDRLSNGVARSIAATGPPLKFRIGIHLPKNADYIAAILGIWKAGGTYVPLEPNLPQERLEYMVGDCQIHAIITGQDASPVKGVPAVVRNPALGAPEGMDDALPLQGKGTDLAYIIYTSGTTGVPKGVMISNDSLLAFIGWCNRYFAFLQNQHNIINVARFSFDQSVLDIALFLAQAKTLFVLDDPKNIIKIPYLIDKYGINIISTVPHVIGVLLNNPALLKKFKLDSLGTIMLGGAMCPPMYVRRIREALPGRYIYNLYGPTEATVYCLVQRLDDMTVDEAVPLPIGRPFDNMEAFILDADHKLLGLNQLGEIALSGPQVMSGYWNMPEKNSRVLIPDPRESCCYNRVYLTGDQGFIDGSNTFHFRGRNDSTIKVAGYRVDLNEIAHNLFLHPDIDEAAAVRVPDPLLEHKIHAYVKPKAGRSLTTEAVTAFLATKLPRYMLPHHIELTDTLPKNPSGKTDLKQLEELSRSKADSRQRRPS